MKGCISNSTPNKNMKELNKRIICKSGVSLSVQANQYAYCEPRIDGFPHWKDYSRVEVGFIEDKENNTLTPPSTWTENADGDFPSTVHGYVPRVKVECCIRDNGGEQKG